MPRWTEEDIIRAMRDWATIFGEPPTTREWMRGWAGEYPSTKTVVAHFGSFKVARERAFPPKQVRKYDWTRETTVEAIREWTASHDGLPPTYDDLTPINDLPSPSTLKRLHGSVTEAFKRAGAPRLPRTVTRQAMRKFLPLRGER